MRDGKEVLVNRSEGPGRCIRFEEVDNVERGKSMESFVHNGQNFISDTVDDGEPVQFVQDWGNVVVLPSLGSEAG